MTDNINVFSYKDFLNYSNFEQIETLFQNPIRIKNSFLFRFKNKICFSLPDNNVEQLNINSNTDSVAYKLMNDSDEFSNFNDFLNNLDNFIINTIHTNSYDWLKQSFSAKLILESYKHCYKINDNGLTININVTDKTILDKYSTQNKICIVSLDKIIFNKGFYAEFNLIDIHDTHPDTISSNTIDFESILNSAISWEISNTYNNNSGESNNLKQALVAKPEDTPVEDSAVQENNLEQNLETELVEDTPVGNTDVQENDLEQNLETESVEDINGSDSDDLENDLEQNLESKSVGANVSDSDDLEQNSDTESENPKDSETIYNNRSFNSRIEKKNMFEFENIVLKNIKKTGSDFDSTTQVLSYQDYKNVKNVNNIKKKILRTKKEQRKLRENSRRANTAAKLLNQRAESLNDEIHSYEIQLTKTTH